MEIYSVGSIILSLIFLVSSTTSNTTIRHGITKRNSDRACDVVINEFNTDSCQRDKSLFLEFDLVCSRGRRGRRPNNLLTNYYIVILRAEPPASVFYLDLDDVELRSVGEDRVFTIGDPGIPDLDLTLDSPRVRSVFKNTGQPRLLDPGNNSPFAVLLLYTQHKRDVSWLAPRQANDVYTEIMVSELDVPRIRHLITDMVTYGKKTQASNCALFDLLWPDYVTSHFGFAPKILRDIDAVGYPDYSLNRCTAKVGGFLPETFQYDVPSPAKRNPCKGVYIKIEDVINTVSSGTGIDVEPMETCSSDISGMRYVNLNEATFENYRAAEIPSGEEDPDMGSDLNTLDQAERLTICNAMRKKEDILPISVSPGTTTLFDESWIATTKDYFPNNGAVLMDKSVQTWIRFTIPGSGSQPFTFHCEVCQNFFRLGLANVKRKQHIMTPEGYFSPIVKRNSEKIIEHEKNEVHLTAIKYQYDLATATCEEERKQIRLQAEKIYHASLDVTAKIVKTVFTEVLANVAFMYHSLFIDLQKSNGVDMGIKHHHTKAAAWKVDSISVTMHRTLLTHLVSEDKPYTLIVDASTNDRNIPFLVCHLFTTEDGYPITYFYRIIELEDGETAEATFNSFWNMIQKDEELVTGFENYIRTRVTLFSSDNAAVMISTGRSFLSKFAAKIDKRIPNIGCLAHKTSLVLKSAIRDRNDDQLKFIADFEKNLNDFFIFYASRGSKRLQRLTDTAEKYGFKLLRFRKNIAVRWAAGEYYVIKSIVTNIKAAERDLFEIQSDPAFTNLVKQKAAQLYLSATDITTNLLYREFLDMLTINKGISEAFQQRSSLLLDHYQYVFRAMADYQTLQNDIGDNLQQFLSTCHCNNVCIEGSCSLINVETCDTLTCDGIKMSNNVPNSFKLSEVREKIYTRVVEAMNTYFSVDFLQSMEVLDNRGFSSDVLESHVKAEVIKVCQFLVYENDDCSSLSNLYYDLVLKMQLDASISENFDGLPSKFWPFILQNQVRLEMPSTLTLFLEKILVLSDSSAEAERAFSIMNIINSDARSNLQPKTVDHILRIKMNNNKKVSEIDYYKYAEEFVTTHSRSDDITIMGGFAKTDVLTDAERYRSRVSRLF